MKEVLSNNNEQISDTSKPTKWDGLRNIPFNGEKQSENHETELTSPSDVLDDVQKYVIKDGKVYSRETGQEESDEDMVLRIKTSRFLFNEAKAFRDENKWARQRRTNSKFVDQGPASYIDSMMDRYGFKDENTGSRQGKLLKELVDTGLHHKDVSGFNLEETIYGMFVGQKGDLGKAVLERRLKQHGLKMIDMSINFDTLTNKRSGSSIIDIKVSTTPIVKTENISNDPDFFSHPAAEQLSKLEEELTKAQEEGDEEAAKGYRAALKMVVERNRLEVSPEDWDNMNDDQKERFYKLKMKEERVLGDKDAFNFWNSNLKRLKNKF